MRSAAPSTILAVVVVVVAVALSGTLSAQLPMTRFFVLPDSSPAPLSDSTFAGQAGTTSFAFDFTEDLRFARGAFVNLSQDITNPYVWHVIDYDLPATDIGLGAQVAFERPASPGPYGTWTSSSANGFPDYANVTVSMQGSLTANGLPAGTLPPMSTLTVSGQILPGYYHNFITLTGSFSGVTGTVSLHMKKDFYPPNVTWEMVARPATSTAQVAGAPSIPSVQGGFTLQRGIATPNVYAVKNLHIEVGASPPIVISTPLGQNAGNLTFDSGSRGLTGSLSVLVDGVPATIPIDGVGESFSGCVMHPTNVIIDEVVGVGALIALHLEISSTELVPTDPPTNDFQIGLTTSLVLRGRAGDFYACAATLNALPGINTTVGDIPVTVDDLLLLSIDPANPYFSNMLGIIPPAGEVLVNIAIPNEPSLIGATFFMGGGTFDPATMVVHAATNSHRAIVK